MTSTRTPGTIFEAPPEYRILDDLDDWYLLVSEDCKIIWANQAFRHITGVFEGDLGQIVHALRGSGDPISRILMASGDGDEIPGFECWVQGLDGGERLCLCSGRKTSSDEGWLLRFQTVPGIRDWEKFIEYTGAATILIEDGGTISAANTGFEHLSGYSREDIIGIKQLTDFVAFRDERRRLMGYHALRRRDPAAAPGNYSFSFIDRSGNIHIVEVTIGMIPGVNRSMMSLIDVTARKRVEEALQKSEERLNLAFTAANDGLVDWDLTTEAIFCSPRCFTMLGYEPGTAMPTTSSLLSIVHPDDRDHLEEGLAGMVAGERSRLNVEFRARSASGEWIYLLGRLKVVRRDRDGTPLRIAGTYSDITERKEAERELLIRGMAMESSLTGIVLADLDERIIYVNHTFLAMNGWEQDKDIIGKPVSILWADQEEGGRVQEEVLQSGAWSGEVATRRRDGAIRTLQLAISTVTDESGKALCLMGSGIDISQQKEAERDIRIRDMAIASSLNAFTIADLDGRLTYVNQAFLSMWGYASGTEVLGRSITGFWQDETAAGDALQTLLDSGRYVAERTGKHRDGTGFYAMYSGNMVTDEAGAPICLTASIADITDLKRAKEEIQTRNRELSILNQIISELTAAADIDEALEGVLATTINLLDLAGGGIYLVKLDQQSARLVCTQNLPEDFPGHAYIPDITAPPYADVLVDGNAVFSCDPGENNLPPYAAIPIVAPGGVIGSLNLLRHGRKGFTGADRPLLMAIGKGIGRSIERTLLIQQLEKAQREANLYLDILSHDIRNAENISGLYIDLLIDAIDGEAKGYAQRVRSSIRKSVEILRNVSTIRRIHHESTSLVPISLDRVIQEEIGDFSEIAFHYDGTDLMAMADPLLTEVFTNLIGNAVKFGGSAVEVTIRVEESGDELLVSVEDTGPGIPDETKEAVFMRFGKNMNQKSGQGLGLYITRMLIERYGGQIRVDDRVPGRSECGAAFRFTLRRA